MCHILAPYLKCSIYVLRHLFGSGVAFAPRKPAGISNLRRRRRTTCEICIAEREVGVAAVVGNTSDGSGGRHYWPISERTPPPRRVTRCGNGGLLMFFSPPCYTLPMWRSRQNIGKCFKPEQAETWAKLSKPTTN